MARIKTVKKARQSKKNRICSKCAYTIQPGESYHSIAKMVFPRGGYMVYFCHDHYPRPSETLSGKQADYARMHEDFDDAIGNATSPDDLLGALQDLDTSVTELSEEYRDSATNIEDGFGHPTYQSEIMGTNSDSLSEYSSHITQILSELENDINSNDEDSDDDGNNKLDDLLELVNTVTEEQPDLES